MVYIDINESEVVSKQKSYSPIGKDIDQVVQVDE